MAKTKKDDPVLWYKKHHATYQELTRNIRTITLSLINAANIDYLSVRSRTKTIESFSEKLARKTYRDPRNEITDLAGVRVITFIETDVTRVSDLIKSSFRVDLSRSLDKTDELGIDRFGYRSVHYVCDMGDDRNKLPEFSMYKGLFFEVQIRTLLQHAWAEIEHDRNYKFSGVLPTPLRRRLYLLAGSLEIVDREFAAIAKEIDDYALEVSKQTKAGNLQIELNSTSLLQYLPEKLRGLEELNVDSRGAEDHLDVIINELRAFGITTLADLDQILNDEFFAESKKYEDCPTYAGLLRSAMMYSDLEKYFDAAWDQDWTAYVFETVEFLASKYGRKVVKRVFDTYGLEEYDSPDAD